LTPGSATVPDAGPGAAYLWSIANGSITSSATLRTVAFVAGATGSVTLSVNVSAASGCPAVSSLQISIVAATDAISNAILADAPFAYYRLSEPAGTAAYDSSGNARDGTYTGGVTRRTGGPLAGAGSAAGFDGVTGYVALPGTFGGSDWSEATVEAWVRPAVDTHDFMAVVESFETGFVHDHLHDSAGPYFYGDTGSAQLAVLSPAPLNTWRHVVVVCKSGDSRLYVNGAVAGTSAMTFNSLVPVSALQLGRGYLGGRFFNGSIAEVSIYRKALTSVQVASHYNAVAQGAGSLLAPAGLSASGAASSVSLTWSGVSGAEHYEVLRSTTLNGFFTPIDTTASPVYIDTSVSPATTYLYRVRAVSFLGNASDTSHLAYATTMTFSDDPLSAGVTTIQARHLAELRGGTNALRAAASLAPATWSEPIAAGTYIRASHLTELRNALTAALGALGVPSPAFDALIGGSSIIQAVHIQQLREAIRGGAAP